VAGAVNFPMDGAVSRTANEPLQTRTATVRKAAEVARLLDADPVPSVAAPKRSG
jgi:hypothetical protein